MSFRHPEGFDDGVDGLDGVSTALGPLLRLRAVDLRSLDQGRKNRCQATFQNELGKVSDRLGEASAMLLGDVQVREVVVDQLKRMQLFFNKGVNLPIATKQRDFFSTSSIFLTISIC